MEFARSLKPIHDSVNEFNSCKKNKFWNKISNITRDAEIVAKWINNTGIDDSQTRVGTRNNVCADSRKFEDITEIDDLSLDINDSKMESLHSPN